MATTRSTQRTQRRQPASSVESARDALPALAHRAARMQIAGFAAVATSLTDWAQAAGRFAQFVGDELLRCVDGEADSAELLARLSRATSSHLRELSAVPRAATDHFDARLARVSTDT